MSQLHSNNPAPLQTSTVRNSSGGASRALYRALAILIVGVILGSACISITYVNPPPQGGGGEAYIGVAPIPVSHAGGAPIGVAPISTPRGAVEPPPIALPIGEDSLAGEALKAAIALVKDGLRQCNTPPYTWIKREVCFELIKKAWDLIKNVLTPDADKKELQAMVDDYTRNTA